MPARPVAILGVPSSAGARKLGLEQAPRALREAGLVGRLRERGVAVVDHGDLPSVGFEADPAHPRERSLDRVCGVARSVTASVEDMVRGGALPLVLGGDCTITIGVLAGMVAQQADLGLLYFDGDLDLNTPATTPSGLYDGMVMAHVLGDGSPALARLGPRCPLVSEDRIAFFAYDLDSGFTDAAEVEALERSRALRYSLSRVRDDAVGAAREALSALEARAARVLVHFDVDATDLPAVDVPHPRALAWDSAAAALATFLASPRCAGLVVTEFLPQQDGAGTAARQIVDGLADAFGAATGSV